MRYFTYIEPVEDTIDVRYVTMSEEEIKQVYYPWWSERMIKKYGKEEFEKTWSFEECLEDWKVVHYAWGVKE